MLLLELDIGFKLLFFIQKNIFANKSRKIAVEKYAESFLRICFH